MSRPQPSAELAVFALGLPLLALMAAPGITWIGSGELATAAYGLGGGPPPGQPALSLLGKLASLLPVGEIGFRIALLSAASMAAAAAGTVALARALVPSEKTAAAAAGALVLLSPVLQVGATRVAGFGPVAALLVWAMARTVRYLRSDRRRPADALIGLLACGAAATLQPVVAVAAAVPIVAALAAVDRSTLRRRAALAVALALLPLVAYLYLPVRAAAGAAPIPSWGAPSSAGALWRLVADGGAVEPAGAATRFAELALLCGEGLGLGLVLGGLGGLCFGAISGLRGAGVVLATAAAVLGAAALRGPGDPDIAGHAAPALLLMASGLAPLVGAVLRMLPGTLGRLRPLAALAILLPVAAIGLAGGVARATDSGFRRGDGPTRYAADTVGRVAPGPALYLASSRPALAAALYERVVAGHRPDVAVVEPRLLRQTWFARYAAAARPELSLDASRLSRDLAAVVSDAIADGTPVAGDDWRWHPHAQPLGLAFAYGAGADGDVASQIPRYRGEIGRRMSGRARLLHATYWAARGDLDTAARLLQLPERFAGAGALAAAPARPALYPLVPARTRVFLFEGWQAALLADDLSWRAGLADGDRPPPTVYERRVHWSWRRVLAGARTPADPTLPTLDAEAYARLGNLLASGDRTGAADAYRRALTLEPGHSGAVAGLRALSGSE